MDRLGSGAGGQIASSVSIRAWPRRTAGWRTSQRRNRRFVVRPRTTVWSSASVSRRSASARSAAMGDDLREHRIEPARHLVAGDDPGIDADAVAGRPADRLDPAGRRQEPGLRVLGVEADLDRVPARPDVRLPEPERLAGGDPDLVGDEVAAGDELRDRVLDLEPRVHLEEEDLAAVVEEELAGAGALVADRRREREGGLGQAAADRGPDGRRRRLLEHLLVAPLDRAVALAEMDAAPVAVEEDLDLDVARALDEPLEDQPLVAERARAPRGGRRRAGRAARRARGRSACPCHRRRRPA